MKTIYSDKKLSRKELRDVFATGQRLNLRYIGAGYQYTGIEKQEAKKPCQTISQEAKSLLKTAIQDLTPQKYKTPKK